MKGDVLRDGNCLTCQSLALLLPSGVSQGQEEGEGPLGHTRRFGQFWIVTMHDPPQTGTWQIQVTAEGTPRVRVQGKGVGIPGKGRLQSSESTTSHIHPRKFSDCLGPPQLRHPWTSSSTLGFPWRMAPTLASTP